MYYKELLPNGCKYIPIDYVKRSDDSIVCDFNSIDFPDIKADVALVSGVLHYIEDPVRFLNWVCDVANRKIIVRHILFEIFSKAVPPTPENYKFLGIRSMISMSEIKEVISKRGFTVTREEVFITHEDNPLLCFEKVN